MKITKILTGSSSQFEVYSLSAPVHFEFNSSDSCTQSANYDSITLQCTVMYCYKC